MTAKLLAAWLRGCALESLLLICVVPFLKSIIHGSLGLQQRGTFDFYQRAANSADPCLSSGVELLYVHRHANMCKQRSLQASLRIKSVVLLFDYSLAAICKPVWTQHSKTIMVRKHAYSARRKFIFLGLLRQLAGSQKTTSGKASDTDRRHNLGI